MSHRRHFRHSIFFFGEKSVKRSTSKCCRWLKIQLICCIPKVFNLMESYHIWGNWDRAGSLPEWQNQSVKPFTTIRIIVRQCVTVQWLQILWIRSDSSAFSNGFWGSTPSTLMPFHLVRLDWQFNLVSQRSKILTVLLNKDRKGPVPLWRPYLWV